MLHTHCFAWVGRYPKKLYSHLASRWVCTRYVHEKNIKKKTHKANCLSSRPLSWVRSLDPRRDSPSLIGLPLGSLYLTRPWHLVGTPNQKNKTMTTNLMKCMDAEDCEVFHGRVDRSWLWTRVWVRGRKSRWGGMLQAQEPGGSWKPFQWTVKVQSILGDSTGPRKTHGAYVANNSRQYGTPSLRRYRTWLRAGEWESAPPGRVHKGLLQGEVTLSQACYHHAQYLNYLFTVYQASFQTPACVMPTLSLWCQHSYCLCLTSGEVEAQRGEVTCPRSPGPLGWPSLLKDGESES